MGNSNWTDYLGAPLKAENLERSRETYQGPFQVQRELMERVVRQMRPARIACLGAGFLNDIPLAAFIQEAEELYLIDWIPGISRAGFSSSLISEDHERIACLLCDERCPPDRYCDAFRPPIRDPERVCSNFKPEAGMAHRCVHYVPGSQPRFMEADITSGRASAFARHCSEVVQKGKTIKQVFQRALSEGKRCAGIEEEMKIPDDSIDLVTVSMVVSQFDNEPYAYFSRLLAEKFGVEQVLENEEKLRPLLEQLRSLLFRIQAEGLVREMHRIVNKDHGRIFFSVEFFRSLGEKGPFFLVHEIPRALEMIGDYFHFDFEPIPIQETLTTFSQNEGTSVIQCYVLSPITD